MRDNLAYEIKRLLPAVAVFSAYGLPPNRSGFVQCPFHQGDRHASLKVYSGNKAGWHCFGCGAGGSVIDFAMRYHETLSVVSNFEVARIIDSERFAGSLAQVEMNTGYRVTNSKLARVRKVAGAG